MTGHQTGYITLLCWQLSLFVCIFYFAVWKCGVRCQNSLIYVITTNETMESEDSDDEVDDELSKVAATNHHQHATHHDDIIYIYVKCVCQCSSSTKCQDFSLD